MPFQEPTETPNDGHILRQSCGYSPCATFREKDVLKLQGIPKCTPGMFYLLALSALITTLASTGRDVHSSERPQPWPLGF